MSGGPSPSLTAWPLAELHSMRAGPVRSTLIEPEVLCADDAPAGAPTMKMDPLTVVTVKRMSRARSERAPETVARSQSPPRSMASMPPLCEPAASTPRELPLSRPLEFVAAAWTCSRGRAVP